MENEKIITVEEQKKHEEMLEERRKLLEQARERSNNVRKKQSLFNLSNHDECCMVLLSDLLDEIKGLREDISKLGFKIKEEN